MSFQRVITCPYTRAVWTQSSCKCFCFPYYVAGCCGWIVCGQPSCESSHMLITWELSPQRRFSTCLPWQPFLEAPGPCARARGDGGGLGAWPTGPWVKPPRLLGGIQAQPGLCCLRHKSVLNLSICINFKFRSLCGDNTLSRTA